MKKRLFFFTLVFTLIFTNFVFASNYNFDSDFVFPYDFDTSKGYVYYVINDFNGSCYYLTYEDNIYTYLNSNNSFQRKAGEYWVSNNGINFSKNIFSGSSIIKVKGLTIISSTKTLYDYEGNVFFSPLPLTPLQEVAPEIFPLVKKQVGGVLYGTIFLISIPIFLILLKRLCLRWFLP